MSQPKEESYNFRAVKDFDTMLKEMEKQKIEIQYSKDTNLLFESLKLKRENNSSATITIPNRLVIHPMEGCDGNSKGDPTNLTRDRYRRFGRSGAALIWCEATAIMKEARANPRQIMITKKNWKQFKNLVEIMDDARIEMLKENDDLPKEKFIEPLKILQLTHSGRYSRPNKDKNPMRAYKCDFIDEAFGIDPESGRIVSDEYLKEIQDYYLQSIELAEKAGFDGVDIKSCHRYLISELLSGYSRKNSLYGGASLENRTRFLTEIIREAKNQFPKMIVAVRLNIYDGIRYPYGFGVKKDSKIEPPESDPEEPVRLIKGLHELGVNLVNYTVGNPYLKPYLSRPYDLPSYGAPSPPEHPLKSIQRIVKVEHAVSESLPSDVKVIGTGFSWFRQWASYFAAGEIQNKSFDLIGFGRMSFANPMFPVQIFRNGNIYHGKTCITCSKCTDLMRFNSTSGCPIRYPRVYAKIYKKAKKSFLKTHENNNR
ncbi:MAG: flavin oxidoreductase/NADH oxidase [Candidatus Lokiarchaeota archaeon]|nr:flavin oxidoreductase/NADH oxidase [Candidatus Lokiarchaeota archaeon]